MSQLEEYELFAEFIGEKLSLTRLRRLGKARENSDDSYADCETYVIDMRKVISENTEHSDNSESIEVYLYLINAVLKGGRVVKRVWLPFANSERSYETDADESELMQIKNVIHYVTEEDKNE